MFDTERFICEVEAQPPLYDVTLKEYSNREVKAKCWYQVAVAVYDDWGEIEVATQDERVKDLMKKWKAIRDSFVNDHRTNTATGTGLPATKKKKYVYYDQLLFLLPHVKGNQKTTTNIAPNGNEAEVEGEQVREEEEAIGESTPTEPVAGTSKDTNPAIVQATGNKRKAVNNPNIAAGKRTALERSVLASTKDLTKILASSLQMQKEEKKKEEEKNVDKFGHKAFMMSFVPVLESMPFNKAMQLRGQISNIFTHYFTDLNDNTRLSTHSSNSMYQPGQFTPTAGDSEVSNDFNISDYMNLQEL